MVRFLSLVMGFKARIFVCAVFAVLISSSYAFAQEQKPDIMRDKQTNEQRLQQVQENLAQAQSRQQALQAEIEALNEDVGAINRALIEAAKSGHELEAKVSQAEEDLQQSKQAQTGLRQSLASKKALLSEVLAALQRMGRRPPPALLVRPEDALSSIRSALVLGAVVPDIRAQSDVLLKELKALQETTQKVEERKLILAKRFNQLAEDELRLTKLVEEKNRLASRSKKSLNDEKKASAKLAAKARSLTGLIAALEDQISSSAAAARAAFEADARRIKQANERLLAAREKLQSGNRLIENEQNVPIVVGDPTRNEPAVAFTKAKGSLYWPVSGKQLYGFGSRLAGQETSSHIALETRANARVRAPADGWVVYAGPFRSFGNLIILNVGETYHVVMAGLAEVNVQLGRFVLAGEPIGRMGNHRIAAIVPANIGSQRPVITVEFRKQGKPIDSSPWWGPRLTTNTQAKLNRQQARK